MRTCVSVCVRARARVCECVCACVRACVRARVFVFLLCVFVCTVSISGNMTCLYGQCSSCSRKKSVCTNDTLEGAMILWLPETISRRVREVDHPWHGACQERGLRSEQQYRYYCAVHAPDSVFVCKGTYRTYLLSS